MLYIPLVRRLEPNEIAIVDCQRSNNRRISVGHLEGPVMESIIYLVGLVVVVMLVLSFLGLR